VVDHPWLLDRLPDALGDIVAAGAAATTSRHKSGADQRRPQPETHAHHYAASA